MSIREILKNIVDNVNGGLGAVVMGYDGISIDEHIKENANVDVPLLAIEYSAVLKEIKKTVSVLKIGKMEEVSINTESFLVIIRAINEDLFVVLVILKEGNYGKGRYLLKINSPELFKFLE